MIFFVGRDTQTTLELVQELGEELELITRFNQSVKGFIEFSQNSNKEPVPNLMF